MIRKFLKSTEGVVLTEMAFILPVLVMLVFSGVDLSRYILLNQKLDRTAGTMGDLVARAKAVSQANIDDYFLASSNVMRPFHLGSKGVVVVSSILREGENAPQVQWQRRGAGGLTGVTSRYGTQGSTATFPDGFTLNEDENVIVVEIVYDYTPWLFDGGLFGMLESKRLYHKAFFRPRILSSNCLDDSDDHDSFDDGSEDDHDSFDDSSEDDHDSFDDGSEDDHDSFDDGSEDDHDCLDDSSEDDHDSFDDSAHS